MIELLALAALNLPMGQSNLCVQRRPIVLTREEEIGYGFVTRFQIPERQPNQEILHFDLVHRWWPLIGGQNRSTEVHPGYGGSSGNSVGVQHIFAKDDGTPALPGLFAYCGVGQEWGPTIPATSPEQWVDPEDWPEVCPGNPTCYWGTSAGMYDPNQPYSDEWSHTLFPIGSMYWNVDSGDWVNYLTEGYWNIPDWDGSHNWPRKVSWKSTLIIWVYWE